MKAMLVIDMPNDCYDCPCYYEDRDMCEAFNKKAKADSGRPSWCPIKPLPHSKQMENRWFSDDYSKGWNACLDEIVGETE